MTSAADKLHNVYQDHGDKLRFLVVGVLNTAFSYALFWLAIHLFAVPLESATGLTEKTAAITLQWAVWVIAVVWSTVTMKYFVFRSKGHLGSEIGRAYFVYLPAQGLSTLILFVAMQFLGMTALVGQLLAVFVTTILSYFGHKYFTFAAPPGVSGVGSHDAAEPDSSFGIKGEGSDQV